MKRKDTELSFSKGTSSLHLLNNNLALKPCKNETSKIDHRSSNYWYYTNLILQEKTCLRGLIFQTCICIIKAPVTISLLTLLNPAYFLSVSNQDFFFLLSYVLNI